MTDDFISPEIGNKKIRYPEIPQRDPGIFKEAPKPVVFRQERTLYVDCDDTLVMWDKSEFPPQSQIKVSCYGADSYVVPNKFNINLLEKFRKLGYLVVAWSQSGGSWAEAVVKALGISEHVSLCITKPTYCLDDLPPSVWIGKRIWRDPKTGEPDDAEYRK